MKYYSCKLLRSLQAVFAALCGKLEKQLRTRFLCFIEKLQKHFKLT